MRTMPKTTLDRIRSKVTVDPRTQCWIWTGAFKDAKPNIYVVDEHQYSKPPRPWMRDGSSFNHPIRILKRPPKHRRLIRLCEERGGSPFCCCPDHWTYIGEPPRQDENPALDRCREYYAEGMMTLDEIRENYGDEIADQIKEEDF